MCIKFTVCHQSHNQQFCICCASIVLLCVLCDQYCELSHYVYTYMYNYPSSSRFRDLVSCISPDNKIGNSHLHIEIHKLYPLHSLQIYIITIYIIYMNHMQAQVSCKFLYCDSHIYMSFSVQACWASKLPF